MKLQSMILMLVLWIGVAIISYAQPALRGGIIISEVLPDPTGTSNFDTDRSGTYDDTDEFVEIYNAHSAEISLGGLELWDPSRDNWYTFPDTSIGTGVYAVVLAGTGSDGKLPEPYLGNLAFSAGSGSATLNNGGDNVILYDPAADEYIQVVYNGATAIDPITSMDGFSPTATRVGAIEDLGNDNDGISIVREPIDASSFSLQTDVYPNWNASPGNPSNPLPGYWKLTANSPDWSDTSNWDNETLPQSNDVVFIRQTCTIFPEISGSVNVASLIMYPASKLTIKNGGDINLSDLACLGVPENMSSLVDENTDGTGINIDDKFFYAVQLPGYRWWYISPPVSDGTSGAVEPSKTTNLLFQWNETNPNHGWNTILDDNTSLVTGKGYAAYFETTNETIIFEGTLNNGTVNSSFTRTAGVTHAGFNLSGNPYPAYLDWGDESNNPGVSVITNNLEPTIWYRTDGKFATYNKASGTGVNVGTRYIPPLQAFWTKVQDGETTGYMQATNLMCSHQDNSLLKNTSMPSPGEVIRFYLKAGSFTDEIALILSPGASINYDPEDSEKLYFHTDKTPYIYFYANGKKLAMNSIPPGNQNMSIPIILNNKSYNELSLETKGIKMINTDLQILLEDKVTGEMYDLSDHEIHEFAISSNDQEVSRFLLHLLYEPLSNASAIAKIDKIKIYQSGESLVIQPLHGDLLVKGIKIFDVTGKLVFQSTGSFSGLGRFSPRLPKGVYITRVKVNDRTESYPIVIN